MYSFDFMLWCAAVVVHTSIQVIETFQNAAVVEGSRRMVNMLLDSWQPAVLKKNMHLLLYECRLPTVQQHVAEALAGSFLAVPAERLAQTSCQQA